MISVVVPCYRAAPYIDDHVAALQAFLEAQFPQFEIVLVDDGSPDDTAARLRALAAKDSRMKAIVLPHNCGKGAAVKTGALEAEGEYIIFTDADLPYDLAAIPAMVSALSTNDVVLGAREDDGTIKGQRIHRTQLSRLFAALANVVLTTPVPDTQAGIKGFTKHSAHTIFPLLTINRFCFDVEIIAIAQNKGLRIVSIPVRLVNQADSTVRVGLDGITMCIDLVRIFFTYRV